MPRYEFDVTVYATVVIDAESEDLARKEVGKLDDMIEVTDHFLEGWNEHSTNGTKVVSVQLGADLNEYELVGDDDDAWIRCAKEHGLEFVGYDGSGWRGRHDEAWVTDEYPTKGEVAREFCDYEGYEP